MKIYKSVEVNPYNILYNKIDDMTFRYILRAYSKNTSSIGKIINHHNIGYVYILDQQSRMHTDTVAEFNADLNIRLSYDYNYIEISWKLFLF